MIWQPKTRHALIDGDLIAWTSAFVTNNQPEVAALAVAKEQILDMRETLQLDSADIYLTGKGNFRKQIAPSYKANRKDKERPVHINALYDYLTRVWSAELVDEIEADDILGIKQTNLDTIICSLDKDLLQVPGWHYNWRRYRISFVTPEQGTLAFWSQMLTGDTADNIVGVKGIGPVKADKLLKDVPIDKLFDTVYNIYVEKGQEDEFEINYKLLKILTDPVKENNWTELNKLKENNNNE